MKAGYKDVFSLLPIGGLGQIGSNMTLVSGQSESVIIDCGILFPNEDSFGVNYIIPNLEVLKQYNPQHLIITHGHEDHIGAIAHILSGVSFYHYLGFNLFFRAYKKRS